MDRCRVLVDRRAVAANIERLRVAAGPAEVWAVVKADGYGHGATDVGRAALEAGARRLCVATFGEAAALRAAGLDSPLLILSPLPPGEEREAAALRDCAVVVSTEDGVRRLADAAGLDVHVKVDTGMGRWGLDAETAAELGRSLSTAGSPNRLAGLMTHFATSDEDDDAFLRHQLERFRAVADGFPDCPRHCANSAALLRFPEARFDAVRPGIAVYGVDPTGHGPERFDLQPVLRWTSVVRALRDLDPGESSGYGRRFIADRPARIALVPVGYADGYPRRLSGVGEVLVGGRRRRVAATVSMDQMAVLLEDGDEVQSGDEVVLIGGQGGERIHAEHLAAAAGTNAYEIVCGVRSSPTRATTMATDEGGTGA